MAASHDGTVSLLAQANNKYCLGSDAGVWVVDTLYGDTLGDMGTPGATYESMMRYNTDTIVQALK